MYPYRHTHLSLHYCCRRLAVPDTSFMLSIKINSHDFIEGGFGPEECQEMIQRLETARVDLIELSGTLEVCFVYAIAIVLLNADC